MKNKVYVLVGAVECEFSEVVAIYACKENAESIASKLSELKGNARYSVIGETGDNVSQYDYFDVHEHDLEL